MQQGETVQLEYYIFIINMHDDSHKEIDTALLRVKTPIIISRIDLGPFSLCQAIGWESQRNANTRCLRREAATPHAEAAS